MSEKRERHRWPEDGDRLVQKTERECLRGCRTLRVTFHPEGRRAYMKYCRDGEWFDKAPACEPAFKPRGNDGIVNAEICHIALHLVGNIALPAREEVAGWTQSQLDRAYDWAMRLHLNASDNDDVIVPPRPDWLHDRWAS